MTDTVIKIENLSKKYQLGEYGTGTLSHDIHRWWAKVRGLEDPYTYVNDYENNLTTSLPKNIWALKDFYLDIKRGEVLGIIGKNGAGKSTLLKLISRITAPTTGFIKVKGRVASLLEVGTGFHSELTGRENIFLNGAIHGMSKVEIKKKFDEIVAFSEIEKFLDTPVKRYSSGMYVKLAFAVAAHLEPDVLIVDEVLAVGDVGFQNKCFKKMGEFESSNVTVILVTHNMSAITRLCNRGIILQLGRLDFDGPVLDAANRYLAITSEILQPYKIWAESVAPGNETVRLLSVKAFSEVIEEGHLFDIRQPVTIEFTYRVYRSGVVLNPAFFLYNQDNIIVFISGGMHDPEWAEKQRHAGLYTSRCVIPGNFLAEDAYYIRAVIHTLNKVKSPTIHLDEKEVIGFKVYDPLKGGSARGEHSGAYYGVVRPILEWNTACVE